MREKWYFSSRRFVGILADSELRVMALCNGASLSQEDNVASFVREGIVPMADEASYPFYPLIEAVTSAVSEALVAASRRLAPSLEPLPALLQFQAGYAESPGWFLIQATEFDPEALTVLGLRQRDAYAAEELVQALLEVMTSVRWLDRVAPGSYVLAPTGRELRSNLLARRRMRLGEILLPPAANLDQLAQLLRAIIEASLASSTPPSTWSLAHSRRRAPGNDASTIEQIVQCLEDFNAFRDDAHMAAWRPYGVDGAAWEAFSFIWSSEANTIPHISERLSHRGYSQADYLGCVEDLVQRGWLTTAEEATYLVSDLGQMIRSEAERHTDEYFYAPWAVLPKADITRTRLLLEELRDFG